MVLVDDHEYLSDEEKRLKEDRERTRYWKKWGPYVAERQWATGSSIFSFSSFPSIASFVPLVAPEICSFLPLLILFPHMKGLKLNGTLLGRNILICL